MKTIIYDIEQKKIIHDFKDIDIEIESMFFDRIEFHNYHQKNCEQVYRVINIKKNKIIAIYYIGIRNNSAFMPYSSPFSYINYNKKISYNEYNYIIEGMKHICENLNLNYIKITLPPFIYNKEVETQFIMMINNGFKIEYIDINHYFDLRDFVEKDQFISNLPHAQRKNYKRSMNENLKFCKINNEIFEDAFEVIETNRKEKGYPLRMDRKQIKDILSFADKDIEFFLVKDGFENKTAAAMVYKVSNDVCQVIYWGHINEYSRLRPMSMLSVELCEYYKNKGFKYLDIGPSSENGNISINLAQFKVDMGCDNTSKYTLSLKLTD